MTERGMGGRLSTTAGNPACVVRGAHEDMRPPNAAAREDTRPPVVGVADGFGNGSPIGQQVVDKILPQVGVKLNQAAIYPQAGGKLDSQHILGKSYTVCSQSCFDPKRQSPIAQLQDSHWGGLTAREDTRPPVVGVADGFGNGSPIGQQVVAQLADNGEKQFSHQVGGQILPQVGAKLDVAPIVQQVADKLDAAFVKGGRVPSRAENDAAAVDNRPPVRKHPSRNSVHEQGFRSTILFVTVCTEGRNPILADEGMLNIILAAWENAQNWVVGRYVIMPDHIHFFCAPATYPAPDFHRWMKYWKRLAQQAFVAARGDTRPPVLGTAVREDMRPPVLGTAVRGDTRPPVGGRLSSTADNVAKLWQDGCWDTQMRTGAQYEEKWQYVRNNPVRKGLAANADDWPYQGVVHDLQWHD